MTYDSKRRTYLAQIPYLISHYIYEYDIARANISVLLYKGVIDQNEYNHIASLDRDQRQLYIGYMEKNKEVSDKLAEGLAEFRERFINENNIEMKELLSVKNDAIFLINKIPTITKFDNIEFIKKNTYTSYFNLNKLEIYYHLDRINDTELIDIKGINDKKLVLHQGHFIEFLCSVFESIQTRTIDYTIQLVNLFHEDYINRRLDINFYREMNADSSFRISRSNDMSYLLDTMDPSNIEYLNITFNLNMIREIYAILSNMYFNSNR